MAEERMERDRFKRILVWGLILVCGAGILACSRTLPKAPVIDSGTYRGEVDIRLNGFRRDYRVHVPPGYSAAPSLPLVVVIHGAFDTAEGMEKFSGFSDLADREGFVVLYPNGMGILGFLQHWNAGHCCGKAAEDRLDDVGYIAAAIEAVCGRLRIDRRRIYMTGFSNGGMMTYRFAAERGNLLAAAAPLAASIGGRPSSGAPEWRIPEPVRPLPLLTIHGLADDDIPFDGGVSRHRGGERTYLSVEDSVGFWVEANRCRSRIDADLYGGQVRSTVLGDCEGGGNVALYTLRGWGHVWPGRYFTASLPDDNPLKGFDASEIIWAFFKKYQRP
jgi:polyhydroxybutyrate depolymerase